MADTTHAGRLRAAMRLGPEFAPGVDLPPDAVSRRAFLKLMGASAALAGLAGCVEPPLEKILPYADQPPEVVPGVPSFYATSMVMDGYATGLLVESREGRPVKIEGNPDHPASLGAAGVFEQASILQLYDPDRAQAVTRRGAPASWDALAAALGATTGVAAPFGPRGEGLYLLLEPTSSPLLLGLLARVLQRWPAAIVHWHDPLGREGVWEGARLVFGRALQARHDFSRAAVVVSLDSDFLASGPFHLRHARDFASGRRIGGPQGTMSRLYAAEAMPSPTGSVADHRLRVRPGEVHALAAGLLTAIAQATGTALPASTSPLPQRTQKWVGAAARDLVAHRGEGIVIAGERQPAEVHALAHLANALLGNHGRTITFSEPVLTDVVQAEAGIVSLAAGMRAGEVRALVVLGGNPAYTAPADLDLPSLLRRVPRSVYLGLYADETAAACEWHVPTLHYLEEWGDARAADGTLSAVQPLIRPLYPECRGAAEPLALLAGAAGSTYDLLRDSWRPLAGAADFEGWWAAALQRGVVEGTQAPAVTPVPRMDAAPGLLRASPATPERAIEVVFRADPKVHDGRFANLAWLQELPHPVTKLTWDNAAVLSPRTAASLGVATGEMLELRAGARAVRAPAFVLPGHADGCVTLALGYGRAGAESVARGVGVDANRLRTSGAPYFAAAGVHRVTDAAGNPVEHELATTQQHWSMEGRPIALHATLDEYRRDPQFAREQRGRSLSLYPSFPQHGEQWGMTIDLSLCTGCGACVVACQAENNIPVVGKQGVLDRREMHWLRIDQYLDGDGEDPRVLSQPMMCQHCEKAPCEYVCPVNATTHSPDGLNEMVYNRCVGTRFCSNNCPYKVRRFNWFAYNADKPETLRMLMNPDVTVRERGVMEKCTYCVQRIRRHQIDAQVGDAPPAPLQTACQQACPTRAIVFGNLADPASDVARSRAEPRAYSVLHELGTDPRTRYLARISNPNPAADGGEGGEE